MRTPSAKRLPSGSYRCQVRINGKSVSVTRQTAYEAERDALILKTSGKYIPDLTLYEAITAYINGRENVLSESTLIGYEGIRRNRFQSIMRAPIKSVNWQNVVNDEARLVSPKTLKNAWGLVASSLKFCGYPVPEVTLSRVVTEEHEFFEPEQILEFCRIIEGHENEAEFLLCLHGLRKSEMLAIKDEDIYDGFIHVHGAVIRNRQNTYFYKKANKTDKSRRSVPIFVDRLKELHIDRQCHPDTVADRFNWICRNNDLPMIGLHGLRHSFVSLCYYLGLSIMVTMRYGGYSNPYVVQKIYTHLSQRELTESERKLRSFASLV